MWLRLGAFSLGILSLLVLLASGPGTRLGLWDWRTGLGMLRYAAYLGIAACAVSVVLLLVPRWRAKSLLAALLMGLAALAPPYLFLYQARAVPLINDIATDSQAQEQRAAYPDIQPIVLKEAPSRAFERAQSAASALGWEVPGGASRVDVRSKSRVGRGDAGTNARRIRGFRAELLK